MAQRLSDRLANIARVAARSEATRLQYMIVEIVDATAGNLRQSAAHARIDLPPTLSIIPGEKQAFAPFQSQECRSNHSKQRSLNIAVLTPLVLCMRVQHVRWVTHK